MQRRAFIKASAATIGALASPALRAEPAKVLRFAPAADLAAVDPHFGIAFITRNHAFLVFDFLYGVDAEGRPQPQMAAGHTAEDGGRAWTVTLRDDLRFHDDTPVRARDVVASLKRWASRDVYAKSVFDGLDSLTAPTDSKVEFRFKRPFRLVPELLAKPTPYCAAIMPERLAATPGTQALTEIVGSGPYRYLAAERVVGSRNVYVRYDGYRPVPGGAPSATAGPKLARFDRIEWVTMPDAGTASAALQSGELDWWEQASNDLVPLLDKRRDVKVELLDPVGFMALMRFNHLVPPFDNPAIRRAFLGAFDQADMMTAVAGENPEYRLENVGFFHPTSSFASQAGLEALTSPRNLAAVKAKLAAAGYRGELIRLIAPADLQPIAAMSEVAADVLRRLDVNLEYVSIDWGSALARLSSKNPIEQGGWSATCNYTAGTNTMDPSAHGFLRSTGSSAIFGWPNLPKVEALRTAWLEATDPAEQKRLVDDLQRQALEDVPYIPLGGFRLPSAYRRDLTGFIPGPVPLFYGVHRA